jgi:hypothetical protein
VEIDEITRGFAERKEAQDLGIGAKRYFSDPSA